MTDLPKIALGAWAWGNDGTFGSGISAESLKPIFDTAMEHGLNLWDTAYAYGRKQKEFCPFGAAVCTGCKVFGALFLYNIAANGGVGLAYSCI